MTIFNKHLWHRWSDVLQNVEVDFMQHNFTEPQETGYRICSECLKVQEYNYDSQGGWWWTLDEKRQRILMEFICKKNGKFMFVGGVEEPSSIIKLTPSKVKG